MSGRPHRGHRRRGEQERGGGLDDDARRPADYNEEDQAWREEEGGPGDRRRHGHRHGRHRHRGGRGGRHRGEEARGFDLDDYEEPGDAFAAEAGDDGALGGGAGMAEKELGRGGRGGDGVGEELLEEVRALRAENAALRAMVAPLAPLAGQVEMLAELLGALRTDTAQLAGAVRSITLPAAGGDPAATATSLTDVRLLGGAASTPAAGSGTPVAGGLPGADGTRGYKKKNVGYMRLWTGSWNMGAKDPFEGLDIKRNMSTVARLLGEFVPLGYDVYVLAVQEGVSDDAYEAFAEYTGTFRLPLHTKLYPAKEDKTVHVRSRRMGRAVNVSELYSAHLRGEAPEAVSSTKDMLDRVLGRGDGSFVSQKFTGIAVFVAPPVVPYVRLLGVYKQSFGVSEGSKGGVAVALGMYDATAVFVSCHLASKRVHTRAQQYRDLVERFGRKLGGRGFQLNEQFHHVVWMGDMNYKCHTISANEAVTMLETGRRAEMFDKYDGMNKEKRDTGIYYNYLEPIMAPDFYPTYKKVEGRGNIEHDEEDPSWVRRVYVTEFKEPFYKGGRIVERVPGWCDRIQYHSIRSRAGQLVPELLDDDGLGAVEAGSDGGPATAAGAMHNYHSVNTELDGSDHSPVFCTWSLEIEADDVVEDPSVVSREAHDAAHRVSRDAAAAGEGGRILMTPERMMGAPDQPINVILHIKDVRVDLGGQMRAPRAVNILFPLPYEDSDGLPERAKAIRPGGIGTSHATLDKGGTVETTLKTLVSRASRVGRFHLLMKVSLDNGTKPQCVVCMADGGLHAPGPRSFTFLEALTFNGEPVLSKSGRPVNLEFTVEMTCHGLSQAELATLTVRDGDATTGGEAAKAIGVARPAQVDDDDYDDEEGEEYKELGYGDDDSDDAYDAERGGYGLGRGGAGGGGSGAAVSYDATAEVTLSDSDGEMDMGGDSD